MTFVENGGAIVAVCWGTYQGQPMCAMTPTLYLLVFATMAGLFIGGFCLLKWLTKKYPGFLGG